MGQQIIKQPNGKYAVFSSVVDGFTVFNATPDELIELWVKNERKSLTRRITETIAQLDRGEKPYSQFTLTWEEALAEHERNHGEGAGVNSQP